MNIKTISQLPPLDGGEKIDQQACFGLSQYRAGGPDDSKYFSRKITYQELEQQVVDKVDDALLSAKYGAVADDGRPIDISLLRTDIDTLSAGTASIGGVKTFMDVPRIDAEIDVSRPTNVVNVRCVSQMIADHAGFLQPGSFLDVDPMNGSDVPYTYYDEGPGQKQLYWHIDHNQNDSSTWVDEYGAVAGPVVCPHTGNLVCYGWLADNGGVQPQAAWVGMFGMVTCAGQPKWVALQIQPWIVGKYSSTAQYVGFNLPVKAGLRLKIVTGFKVNGNNTALHDKPTLMFAEEGNMPNTFVGYILRDA